MKKFNIFFSIILLLIGISNISSAQSDYQIVQNFKQKAQEIQQEIKAAATANQLKNLKAKIVLLETDYQANKSLLDKSLYPDNFNNSIAKLNNALNQRLGDFTQITTLQTQVTELKTQLDSLNLINTQLLSQIEELKTRHSRDVAHLQSIIHELRNSLYRRDRLVMSMLDSLLPPPEQTGKLSSKEKGKIYSKTKRNDLMSNIKRSISDNIKFLDETSLNPQDLSSLGEHEQNFEKMWKSSGGQIAEIYSSRRERNANINEIDSSFSVWNNAIDQNAWNSIRQLFTNHGITLSQFSSGSQFVNALSNFISNSIKNIKDDREAARITYAVFADTVWNNELKNAWLPYLIGNNQLTYAQQNNIQSKITEWNNSLKQKGFGWPYIVILVVLVIIILMLLKSIMSKKNKPKKTFND